MGIVGGAGGGYHKGNRGRVSYREQGVGIAGGTGGSVVGRTGVVS